MIGVLYIAAITSVRIVSGTYSLSSIYRASFLISQSTKVNSLSLRSPFSSFALIRR